MAQAFKACVIFAIRNHEKEEKDVRKFNVGIMGTGNIAAVMAETLNRMKGVKLYAVASREKVKADVFAGKHGVKKAYGSYEELVKDNKVELIYIATPHSEHYENARLCLENNKPVLCEKSFTANAAQAEELFKLARKSMFLLRKRSGHAICLC